MEKLDNQTQHRESPEDILRCVLGKSRMLVLGWTNEAYNDSLFGSSACLVAAIASVARHGTIRDAYRAHGCRCEGGCGWGYRRHSLTAFVYVLRFSTVRLFVSKSVANSYYWSASFFSLRTRMPLQCCMYDIMEKFIC